MRLGAYDAMLAGWQPGRRHLWRDAISERHRHRYEVDIASSRPAGANAACALPRSPDGRLPEIVEIPGHPWYIGVQFHPELKSKPLPFNPLSPISSGGASISRGWSSVAKTRVARVRLC